MKASLMLCVVMLLIAVPAFSGETAVKVMGGEFPMIIDGNWICPPFTLMLTDSNITVNGFQYERPKVEKDIWKDKPDRTKDFFDWLVRTSIDSAQYVVDAGGTLVEAREVMEKIIMPYVDGDTLKAKFGSEGLNLEYYKDKYPLYVSIPRGPREPEVSYREGYLEPRFKELVNLVELKFLVIKGIGYGMTLSPRSAPIVLPELERMARQDTATLELGREPIVIQGANGPIRIYDDFLGDLVHPKGK